ncbi:MAG: ArsR family transcriptional regulator [Chromatiaceae bacterium]|nr:MAG: ArsR family transcriptional regulator [Chromatiaceae bacterium]
MEPAPTTLFAALAHETRLRCLLLLAGDHELCVCELTYALGLPQPHISRHLAQLREAGLVSDRRAGIWVYYRLHPDLPAWMIAIIEGSRAALAAVVPYCDDAAALAAMPNRPDAARCA